MSINDSGVSTSLRAMPLSEPAPYFFVSQSYRRIGFQRCEPALNLRDLIVRKQRSAGF